MSENPIFNHVNQKLTFIKNPLFSGEPELIYFHIRPKEKKKNTNIVWLKKNNNKISNMLLPWTLNSVLLRSTYMTCTCFQRGIIKKNTCINVSPFYLELCTYLVNCKRLHLLLNLAEESSLLVQVFFFFCFSKKLFFFFFLFFF